jgi:hypothetical protein
MSRPTDRQYAISMRLSPAQVESVLRQAAEEGPIVGALHGLRDHQELARAYLDAQDDPQLSSSLLIGLAVFAILPLDGGSMRVLDVSSSLELSTSTAHRYLKTLIIAGLLERDPGDRTYRRVVAK